MKRLLSLLATLVAWGAAPQRHRAMTYDAPNQTSIKFRMNAGFPGDPNRSHPFSIEPVMNDDVGGAPVSAFGQFCVIDANGNAVRKIGAADQSDAVSLMAWGVAVRPFPTSPGTAFASLDTQGFGTGGPAASTVMDVGRWGYFMAVLNDPTQTPKKGDPVFVWCAASAGNQVQGGITTTFSAGNTVKLANAVFNGPGDAAGNVEVIVSDRRSL